jgi:F-type H+-transporting ATPase subunit epsilon
MQFELITPERIAFSEEVYEAILPTQTGQIAVFPNHIPLITLLKPGVISLRMKKGDADEAMEPVAVSGGFVEITGSTIKVMADTAERADDLDDMKIEQAKAEAKRAASEAKDSVAYADAIGRLEIEIAREKVKNIKRRKTAGR